MNTTNSIGDRLFPAPGGFREAEYLAFLAQRVPKDIRTQLNGDGQPDLGASHSIGIDDLTYPLSSHSFPSDELKEMADILGYIIICYSSELEKQPARHDSYKLIYAISLYLHCFVRGQGPECGGYLAALGILADVSSRLDLEARLQVCRFLGSLAPTIIAEATTVSALVNEPAPASTVLVALSVIVGSVNSDLSLLSEDTLKSENIGWVWAEENNDNSEVARRWIASLKGLVSEMYGPSGRVRQVADRFRLAIEEK